MHQTKSNNPALRLESETIQLFSESQQQKPWKEERTIKYKNTHFFILCIVRVDTQSHRQQSQLLVCERWRPQRETLMQDHILIIDDFTNSGGTLFGAVKFPDISWDHYGTGDVIWFNCTYSWTANETANDLSFEFRYFQKRQSYHEYSWIRFDCTGFPRSITISGSWRCTLAAATRSMSQSSCHIWWQPMIPRHPCVFFFFRMLRSAEWLPEWLRISEAEGRFFDVCHWKWSQELFRRSVWNQTVGVWKTFFFNSWSKSPWNVSACRPWMAWKRSCMSWGSSAVTWLSNGSIGVCG